ncbi:hypothetical protein [Otoolea muris]|nr:hypothetical protein [Otoolea muris]
MASLTDLSAAPAQRAGASFTVIDAMMYWHPTVDKSAAGCYYIRK